MKNPMVKGDIRDPGGMKRTILKLILPETLTPIQATIQQSATPMPQLSLDDHSQRISTSFRLLRISRCLHAHARQVNLTQGPPKRTKAPASLEFNDSDLEGVSLPHDDALVITLRIDAFQVKRILIDTGSSVDILFEDAFLQMGILEDRVKLITSPLYGFTGIDPRFLSKSAERCLPFFKALKNIKNFEWTTECQALFDALKEYLASPPLLSKPVSGEELFLYLAVAKSAVSAVLVREEAARQLPIYYVSKILQGAEQRYPDTEKLAFALLMATRKLRPYFQSHTIVVLTDKPLRQILHKLDLSGHLVPWSNAEALPANLDLLDERREQAAMRLAAYQHLVSKFYDQRVRPQMFRVGDLVLRRIEASAPRDAIGKLAPNWEGPYKVVKLGGPGAYNLEAMDGKAIPRTWNATNLRRYYA
ncbi:hypothetical protein RJ639_019794 [Escallonia herrerae]|uniref:Reverse transcriptase/retrotransposon-derived protein RNase H-like domain-containing protein n=1 Tax=Escallonia herrerae TaxID=1293975 RepID=A0AA88VB89_9ASTE|nr:hypothetical protein RJ639_019794 [Escallonia herrerae]